VYADPIEMQVLRLAKKVAAGAQFLITQPVFDQERFDVWFHEVTRRGIHEQVAMVAGIQLLNDAQDAQVQAEKRPRPMIPDSVLRRLASSPNGDAQRAAGIEIAVETIRRLSAISGLRGFHIRSDADPEAALEVIEESGLGID